MAANEISDETLLGFYRELAELEETLKLSYGTYGPDGQAVRNRVRGEKEKLWYKIRARKAVLRAGERVLRPPAYSGGRRPKHDRWD